MVVGLTVIVLPLGRTLAGMDVQVKLPGLPLSTVAVNVVLSPLQTEVAAPALTEHWASAILLIARYNPRIGSRIIFLMWLLF